MADSVADLERATTPDEMHALLRDDLGSEGFQNDLDENHTVTYIARGPKLLVTFETVEETLRISKNGLPIGLDFAEDKNWSLMHFSAKTESWFRIQQVYDFIDELVDDCFFEEFDQVMFYGSAMGAYAACAFSVASPNSTVMAIAPQATLDTERAGWDMRFPDAKRLIFNDRYGYAPDMLEGANKAFILFDPYKPLDHVHASLFNGPNVTRLKCRHLDGLIELALREMDALHQIIEMAAEDTLDDSNFYTLLRRRRDHVRYLRTLLHALGKRNRPLRVALLCKYVLGKKKGGPFFRKNLAAAKDVLERNNRLPAWLVEQENETDAA